MANQDNPNIIQVEDMVKFCGKHKHIFIYDRKEPQILIEKFLNSCNIFVEGFLVDYGNQVVENLPKPVYTLEQAKNKVAVKKAFHKRKKVTNDTCVIVSNEDYMCNWTYNQLQKYGFKELYFMSEWNKRTIPYKMTPRCKENFWLEVNIADYCNLNCQCCDHFAPIADKYLLDIEEFERDMTRLAELMGGEMGIFKIQGGEPTLHPYLIDFMRITREKFPTSTIFFFTNGILLLPLEKGENGNLWQAMKDYDVTLMVTTYPLKLDFQKIDKKAEEYGLKYERFVEVGKVDPHTVGENKYYGKDIDKLSVHHPFDLKGKVPRYQYISCYQFNESITLRHGKIYTCPFIPYVGYFNKHFNQNLEVTENDYIDIYKAISYEEIAEFCTHRTDFCKYCNIKDRKAKKFAISKKEITEWT
ncbi:MAG: radical SAM protein [Candidatus Gastranaerophilales bacterium]|nr:radical SAM protein [Candidatus Gastranaerophilales bacterium]